jgi:hypothetical protein
MREAALSDGGRFALRRQRLQVSEELAAIRDVRSKGNVLLLPGPVNVCNVMDAGLLLPQCARLAQATY